MKSIYQDIYYHIETAISEDRKNDILNFISKLPQDQQKILDLHYTKQLTIKEIAEKLECSVTTVYTKLHRALFTLKTEFNPGAFENAYSILYPETGKPASATH